MKKNYLISILLSIVLLPVYTNAQNKAPIKSNTAKKLVNNKSKKGYIELTKTDIKNLGFIDAANFSVFGFHLGMTRQEFKMQLSTQPQLQCDYLEQSRENIDGLSRASISYIDKQSIIKVLQVFWTKDQFGISMIRMLDSIKPYLAGNTKLIFEYDDFQKGIPTLGLLKGKPEAGKINDGGYEYIYPENHLIFKAYWVTTLRTKVWRRVDIKIPASDFEPLMPDKNVINKNITTGNIKRKMGEVIDIDGNIYKIISIGEQDWIASNLSVTHFRNGDSIPESKNMQDWFKAEEEHKPSWCYYNYKEQYGKLYGKLYNSYALLDSRGLAPKGWHVSLENEWLTLIKFLGGNLLAPAKMKSNFGWGEENNILNPNGSNSSGFSALPGGNNLASDGNSNTAGALGDGNWWSISIDKNKLLTWRIDADNRSPISVIDLPITGYNGFSVRCIRN